MRFDYAGRRQSEGRIKCKTCDLPMLGKGEEDPRLWHYSTMLSKTFCDCQDFTESDQAEGDKGE